MKFHDILHLALGLLLLLFVIFWIYHIVECLRRKDFRIGDKIFWFLLLLVPVIGLIMYRGIGNEFYKGGKDKSRPEIESAPKSARSGARKRRIPRGGAKIILPQDMNPPAGKK